MTLTGCAAMLEGMPGFTHTSALMVGASKSDIVTQLGQVGLAPKEEIFMKDVLDKKYKNITGYVGDFSDNYNFVVLFDNDAFKEFILQPHNQGLINMSATREFVKGYLLTRKNNKIDVAILR